jgi:2-dehydro-3-deoxyphosphogluconate aldolase/(4S)-4-hydroxy-2-oxoglutarate aldolase
MNDVLQQIGRLRIVPVVALNEAEQAPALGEALVAGGLPVAEITFRTNAAAHALTTLAKRSDMLVGAGTVLTTAQAEQAIDAGARFIVSPGFDPQLVRFCLDRDVPVTPGCATPTDLQQAVAHGLSIAKFFPAEPMGGLAMLKALSGPFRNVQFRPTGGINTDNLQTYLAEPAVLACGGSWMVKPELIRNREFGEITRLTEQAVALT